MNKIEEHQQDFAINSINAINNSDSFKASIINKYPKLFSNKIGKITGVKLQLHIDPNVKPVYQRLRPQPYHLVEPIKRCLDKMKTNGLISRQFGPTPWLSNIHPVPKPGSTDELRITIDMRAANKAILRERHPMRRLEDLIVLVNGTKVLSKLDLNSAYNQFELEENCKFITGFSTPQGAYVWNRLSLGINTASELFQKEMEQLLAGIDCQFILSDDIFVWGVEGTSDHDKNLMSVLSRLDSRGATLNAKNVSCK